jgi:hypothetical protein
VFVVNQMTNSTEHYSKGTLSMRIHIDEISPILSGKNRLLTVSADHLCRHRLNPEPRAHLGIPTHKAILATNRSRRLHLHKTVEKIANAFLSTTSMDRRMSGNSALYDFDAI